MRLQAPSATGTLRWHAKQIIQTHGIAGFYKAVFPTTVRAGILTSSQLGVYDHAKHTCVFSRSRSLDNESARSLAREIACVLLFYAASSTSTRERSQKACRHTLRRVDSPVSAALQRVTRSMLSRCVPSREQIWIARLTKPMGPIGTDDDRQYRPIPQLAALCRPLAQE